MRMVRLVYASTFNAEVDPAELKNIHENARKNNNEIDVSGILIFGNNYFLQCLEGGRTNVNKIYEKISKDSRHKDLIILGYEECHSRMFEKWSMKLLILTEEKKEIVKKYSRTKIFDPYDMSSESCTQLLKHLEQHTKEVD
jgi:hypothetical protein